MAIQQPALSCCFEDHVALDPRSMHAMLHDYRDNPEKIHLRFVNRHLKLNPSANDLVLLEEYTNSSFKFFGEIEQ